MENRIKEQQLFLFADCTSAMEMRANQLRLWYSSIAYGLVNAFRQRALNGTGLEEARCDTIRIKLFKVGTLIQQSVRWVMFRWASGCPYQTVFARAYANLQQR